MNNDSKDCLPDLFDANTAIVLCGMAASKESCDMGHYYAKKTNAFWWVLHQVGLTKSIIIPSADPGVREASYKALIDRQIGLTDLVKGSCGMDSQVEPSEADLMRLLAFLVKVKPKVVAFNGKEAARYFLKLNRTGDIKTYGKQANPYSELPETEVHVLPSTSALAKRYWDPQYWQDIASYV